MKRTLLFAFCCLLSYTSFAQDLPELADLEKQKFYDYKRAVKADADSVFSLGFESLKTLPDGIDSFKQVNSVTFFVCRDMDLEAELPKLKAFKNLIKVSIFSNKATAFPNSILQYTQLKSLTLSGMKFDIPEAIGQLNQLEYLSLGHGFSGGLELKTLPQSLSSLKKLKTLNLWGNKDLVLPDHFYKLKKLEELDLSNVKSYDLALLAAKLKKLKILNLTGTNLKSLAGVEKMKSLSELKLDYCDSLKSLGANFGLCKNLSTLKIQLRKSLCSSATLNQISLCKNLTHLDLTLESDLKGELVFPGANFLKLTTLKFSPLSAMDMPKMIGNFAKTPILKKLTLFGMQNHLPKNMGMLTQVTDLDLTYSKLQTFPTGLLKMPALKKVNLKGTGMRADNPICTDLVKKGVKLEGV